MYRIPDTAHQNGGYHTVKEPVWNERYNIGVEQIDRAHQKLFSIIHRLMLLNENEAENETKRQHSCVEGIKYLNYYAAKHFAEEEEYMQSIRYPGYPLHRQLHEDFRDRTLPALARELSDSHYSVEALHHFLGIFIGWITSHIMIEDYAITGNISCKWHYFDSEENLNSLIGAIRDSMADVFHLELEIISEHYTWEYFEDCIFFRFSYRNQQKEPAHVILVFEKCTLLRTMDLLLEKQFTSLDQTMIETARTLSHQLISGIENYLSPEEPYTLEKDHLLSPELFQKLIDLEYPRCSLLFHSPYGYFAFCLYMP